MAGAPGDLFALAAEWLAVCEIAVSTAAGGPIGRAYVSPGPPVLDCAPQLTVHPGGPSEADTFPLQPSLAPGHRSTVQGEVNLISLTAIAVRCIPTLSNDGALPTEASMEAAAAEIHGDLWAIWNVTRSRHHDGSLFPSPSNSRELFFDPAFPIVPSGGIGGWQIPIRVQLGGYSA